MHGIVTALVTFLLVQGIGVIRHAIANEDILWSRVLSSALLSMVAGTVGGLVGARLKQAEPAG